MRKSFTQLFNVCVLVVGLSLSSGLAWAQPGNPTQHNTTLSAAAQCYNVGNEYEAAIYLNDLYKITGFDLYIDYNSSLFTYDAATFKQDALGSNVPTVTAIAPAAGSSTGTLHIEWTYSGAGTSTDFDDQDVYELAILKFSLNNFPQNNDFPYNAGLAWDVVNSKYYLEVGEPALDPQWGGGAVDNADLTVDIMVDAPEVTGVPAGCSYAQGTIKIDNFTQGYQYVVNGDVINGPWYTADEITVANPTTPNTVIAKDPSGCLSAPVAVTVGASDPLVLVKVEDEEKPCDPDRVTVNIDVDGGTSPYTYYITSSWQQVQNYYSEQPTNALLYTNNNGQFDLPEGEYYFWVEDAAGCSTAPDINDVPDDNFQNNALPIELDNVVATAENCGTKGTYSFTVTGGTELQTGGYLVALVEEGTDVTGDDYVATDEYGEHEYINLDAGNYSLYVKDAKFCEKEFDVVIGGYGFKIIDVTYTDAIECEPLPNDTWVGIGGSITLAAGDVEITGTGGTGANLEFTIYDPENVTSTWISPGNSFIDLAPGHYPLYVREVGTDCYYAYRLPSGVQKFVPIMSPSEINFDVTYSGAHLYEGQLYACGEFDIIVSNITGNLGNAVEVTLLDGSGNDTGHAYVDGKFNNVPANDNYILRVETTEGSTCPKDSVINVLESDLTDVSVITTVQPTCFEGTDGKIYFNVIGGIGDLTYLLDNEVQILENHPDYLKLSSKSGAHTLKVIDATGCYVEVEVDVPYIDNPSLQVADRYLACYGAKAIFSANDFVILNTSVPDPAEDSNPSSDLTNDDDQFEDPGIETYRYGSTNVWGEMTSYIPGITALGVGDYYFGMKNGNGCVIISDVVKVLQNSPFSVEVIDTQDPICPGAPGKITFRISGGVPYADGTETAGTTWKPFRFIYANNPEYMDNTFVPSSYMDWDDIPGSPYHYVTTPFDQTLYDNWAEEGYIDYTYDFVPGTYYIGFEDSCIYNGGSVYVRVNDRFVVGPEVINDADGVVFDEALIEEGISYAKCADDKGAFELLEGAVTNSVSTKLYRIDQDDDLVEVADMEVGDTASDLVRGTRGEYLLWAKSHEDCVGKYVLIDFFPRDTLDIVHVEKLRDADCYGEQGTVQVKVKDGWGKNYTVFMINSKDEESEHHLMWTEGYDSDTTLTTRPATDWLGNTELEGHIPYYVATVPEKKITYDAEYHINVYADTAYTVRVEDEAGCEVEWNLPATPVSEPERLWIAAALDLTSDDYKTTENTMIPTSCVNSQLTAFHLVFHGGLDTDELEWKFGGDANWTPVGTTQGIDYLSTVSTAKATGKYLVHLRRAGIESCVVSQEIELYDPEGITFTPTKKDVTCRGGADGEIYVNDVAGGTGDIYWYQLVGVNQTLDPTAPDDTDPNNPWVRDVDNPTSYTFEDLEYGHYNVYVSDVNGCIVGKGVQVDQPVSYPTITGYDIIKYTTCNDNDGEFKVIAEGGEGDLRYFSGLSTSDTEFEYQFPNPAEDPGAVEWQDSPVFENVSFGTHILWVIDENGCVSGGEIESINGNTFEIDNHRVPMPQPDMVTFDIPLVEDAECPGDSGTITVDVASITGSVSGAVYKYEVMGTDNDHSAISASNSIKVPGGKFKVRLVQEDTDCASAWSEEVIVEVPADWIVEDAVYNLGECADDESGTIEVDVQSGPMAYYSNIYSADALRYQYRIKRENWNSFLDWKDAYSFKVERGDGVPVTYTYEVGLFYYNTTSGEKIQLCTYSEDVILEPGNRIVPNIKDVTCYDDGDMSSALITLNGVGVPDYTVSYAYAVGDLWGAESTVRQFAPGATELLIDKELTNGDMNDGVSGHYWFQVKDAADCMSEPVFITFNRIQSALKAIITGNGDGTATVSYISGGISPYTYMVNGEDKGAVPSTDEFTVGGLSGEVTVTIVDSHGCEYAAKVDAGEVALLSVDANPASGTNMPETFDVVLTFNREVTIAEGDITGGTVTTGTGTEFTVTMTGNDGEEVSLVVGSTIMDLGGNAFAGATFTYTVGDNTAPMIETYSPVDGATLDDNHPTLEATFNENVVFNEAGNVYITKVGSTTPTLTIPVTADMVDGNMITVTYDYDAEVGGLNKNTEYYVTFDAAIVADEAGNAVEGLADDTVWNFTTGDFATGVEDPVDGSLEFKVYPNPFDSYVKVENANELSRVIITNVAGQRVKEVVNPTETIQTGDLRSGIYVITLVTKDDVVAKTERIVKR